MRHWLFKSEPDCYSFTDLENAPGQTTSWDGVRNYQARNFMRDDMKKGDLGFFYILKSPGLWKSYAKGIPISRRRIPRPGISIRKPHRAIPAGTWWM